MFLLNESIFDDLVASFWIQHSTVQHLQRSARVAARHRRTLRSHPGTLQAILRIDSLEIPDAASIHPNRFRYAFVLLFLFCFVLLFIL